jgi:hypothetical protein
MANPGLDLPADRADHFLGLPGAQIVATKTLLAVPVTAFSVFAGATVVAAA